MVEDNLTYRQGLLRLLAGDANLTVVGSATTGEHALDLTRRLHPDVVLLDIALPGMDGIATAHALCRACPGVSVIGLSSYAVASAEALALQQAGAASCLQGERWAGEAVLAAIHGTRVRAA